MTLVQLVLKKGVPLIDAIKELGIKATTARFIIKNYRKTAGFPRKKFKITPNFLKKTQENKPTL